MQLRNRKVAGALAIVALAAAVPLVGGRSAEAVAAASTAPAWAIQPGGTLTASVANGSDAITVNFAKWGGTINFDPDSPGDAAIKIDIDLAGASIGDSFKDDLLQGDEFFGTAGAPTATFQSQSVEAKPEGRYLAHGTLSLHGMSLAQDIEFRLSGSGAQRHVEGAASIDRLAFAIGTGSHGGDLDNAVAVKFAFDAKRG
jgi:polyisoprenoid-binding protein YceI